MSVYGTCDPAFARVRDAFAGNLADRDEHGGAVCVTVGGRTVVDLWGGYADEAGTRPWQADTLVNVFSVGKAMVALLAARLTGQGLLDVDRPVRTWWPEFAQGGKDAVTMRQVLSHQGGLPAVHERLPPWAMCDWGAMTTALAADRPWWEPGTAVGYHVNTYGFLVGEVLARITGRSPGTLLAGEVAGPLGADICIGLPAADEPRVAEFGGHVDPPPECEPDLDGARLMGFNAYFNPSGLSGAGVINTRRWRAAEIPSTNPHASARGIARVFTALAAGGTLDGVTVVDAGALRDATVEQVDGDDLILGRPSRFGLGFQLTRPDRPFGPNPRAYGHFGAGGSLGFCDPDTSLAFGYVTDRLGPRWQNPRNRALIDAVYASLT
jgi:CubicO group peptidase (beta-lactamase class C family)